MAIGNDSCDACGGELAADNYYYVYMGRLQQGPMSDKKANVEYKLCMSCFNMIKANTLVFVEKQKARAKPPSA